MIFYQSEANTSGMGPNFFEMDLDKVIGLAYWGMIDYLGESQGWPEKGWTQGVFDISLEPKPMAYFLKSFFKPEEPLVYIAPFETTQTTQWNGVTMGGRRFTDSWNFTPGSSVKLYTYTNADEVELKVNGKSIGRKSNDTANPKSRNRILWEDVPYAKGKVEAIAYKDGKEVARHDLSTYSDAKKLEVVPDNPAWKADGTDLQHVKVTATDAKGLTDKSAKDMLTFEVNGPAEIVGVINGDLSSHELMTGNRRSLHNGTATVILRSKREPGPVTLTVSAEGLPKKKVSLQTM